MFVHGVPTGVACILEPITVHSLGREARGMGQSRTSIVCGVESPTASRVAVGVAADLAARLGARLVLTHAVDDSPAFPHGDTRDRELQRARVVRAGHRLLQDAAADVDAVLRVTLGDPAAGLHAVCDEEDAELLVVPEGGVARRVASAAARPVVIVPPGAGARFAGRSRSGEIICGYDGSPASERALEAAVGLGQRIGLEPLAVFVDPDRTWTATAPSPVEILAGDPVVELRERAAGADVRMIAVGARGRGYRGGALLGSVSAALAASAAVPVLVVPPTARVQGVLEVDADLRSATMATR
jgi:nucleotide-binding universal stress UspA family protein